MIRYFAGFFLFFFASSSIIAEEYVDECYLAKDVYEVDLMNEDELRSDREKAIRLSVEISFAAYELSKKASKSRDFDKAREMLEESEICRKHSQTVDRFLKRKYGAEK